jgi:hypothetical protein
MMHLRVKIDIHEAETPLAIDKIVGYNAVYLLA